MANFHQASRLGPVSEFGWKAISNNSLPKRQPKTNKKARTDESVSGLNICLTTLLYHELVLFMHVFTARQETPNADYKKFQIE